MKTLAESIRETLDDMLAEVVDFTEVEFTKEESLDSLQQILKETPLFSMATTNDDGTPHINTAFFCDLDMKLYFLSAIESTHCQNILKRPQVAVTIFNTHQEWDKDKSGVQLFGTARECQGETITIAQNQYADRIPAFAEYINEQGKLDDGFQFFEIQIVDYKILDEKQFGEENYISDTI